MKLIKNVNLILLDRIVRGSILFSDKIEKVFYNNPVPDLNDFAGLPGEKPEVLDAKFDTIDGDGLYLSPGFIDIHIHGAAGYDTMDGSYLALNEISKSIIKSGVTSFLPTTMAMPVRDTKKAFDNIRMTMEKDTDGARVLGGHAEGPFFNPDHKGAQAEKYILNPDISLYEDYLDNIRLVTLAPEREGAFELIERLVTNGITVSAGHTGASFKQIMKAKELGLSHLTHLFNGMIGLHHRKPGPVGAALATNLSCELIADFIHLHPEVIRIVLKTKKIGDIILMTDQMMASSLEEGEYELGGQKVIVKDNSARLQNGSLAGSVLTLDQAVRNIYSLGELTLPEVIRMVTLNPACLLNVDEQFGKLEAGYKADLVLMDKELKIKRVFRDGNEIIS